MQEVNILLVEGARAGDDSFAEALQKAEYGVEVVHTGKAALAAVAVLAPDLIVFDASSMRSSGSRTCRRLRSVLGDTPLIHCRAAGVVKDETAAADVYLEQPFTARKLLNRIRTLLPVDHLKEEVIRCGHIVLYRSRRAINVDGQGERRLTPKLAQLLEEFIRHPNELVSRRQLMQNVWQTDYVGDTRTLDVHIRWVRETIEENPGKPKLVRTVRGKGYIFAPPLLKSNARRV